MADLPEQFHDHFPGNLESAESISTGALEIAGVT
jgi:hypothetical protein